MRLATATSWSTWTIHWHLETRLRLTHFRGRPEAGPTQAHRLPRTWRTTTISWKKHRPLWQLLQPWTKGLLHRQHDQGVWNDQLQHSDHSRNRPLQANNRGSTLLDHEQHKRYRRMVGKLQWLAHTRPDIAYSTKQLARDLTAPTELSQKRVKHLPRYLHGTKHYKFTIQPTTTLRANPKNILDLDVHVDADWAGCPTTRKPTSGFNIIFLGTTVQLAAEQATIALSSAESELYAICTGANEGLHLRNFLLETNICSKINLRIHTDSTAGKSIATRQGTSKRAKHIGLNCLYTQDLVKHDILTILRINRLHNGADLFTKYISKETLHRLIQSIGICT